MNLQAPLVSLGKSLNLIRRHTSYKKDTSPEHEYELWNETTKLWQTQESHRNAQVSNPSYTNDIPTKTPKHLIRTSRLEWTTKQEQSSAQFILDKKQLNSIVETMVSGIGKENKEREIKENETLHWWWLEWITNLQCDGMVHGT